MNGRKKRLLEDLCAVIDVQSELSERQALASAALELEVHVVEAYRDVIRRGSHIA
jgi:hypothetical protein